ncbi:MAG: hypothetical protein RQ982_10405 [Gammaproteobacteria bacterium]|nr:hypothetical protein [Gammaproteobacteria bacterium]
MPKRKYRNHDEWQSIIQQQKDSGLNAAAFCQQQGLSSKTFYKRRQALGEKHSEEGSHCAFVPQGQTTVFERSLLAAYSRSRY